MKYLIRLDDFTQGTNWEYFKILENVFDEYSIKPIIGVVPDNLDDSIMDLDQVISRSTFFDKIRNLQKKKYKIAMHGVNHKLISTKKKSIIDINNFGELVEENFDEKIKKLNHGKSILNDENIKVDIYMPPAHWIDTKTLKALRKLDFKYITDGLFPFPKKISGFWFVPQQIWRPREMLIPGVFTICLHINSMKKNEINSVISFIKKNNIKFIKFDDLSFKKFETFTYQLYNVVLEFSFRLMLKLKLKIYNPKKDDKRF